MRELLAEDGSIWVTIDDNEAHYLKVIMDEIFGRKNFLGQVAYERSGVSGIGQGGSFLVNTHENILCFAKSRGLFCAVDLSGEGQLESKDMKRYNRVLLGTGTREEVARFTAPSTGEPVVIYKHTGEQLKTISLRNFENRSDEIMSEYVENFANIFRLTSIQKENEFQNKIMSFCGEGLYSADYLVSRGKKEGTSLTAYYHNGQAFVWLKDTAEIRDEKLLRTGKLSDFWPHGDIPKANLANEGAVDFRRSKKPESLIKRILQISTSPNDLVLDSFLGSGTTAAVAHKMGRRYIGIEMGEHASTHCQPRLKKVVDGEQGGISEVVNWQGGGGFRFYKLGAPIFDADGNINPEIRFAHLAAHIWFCETKTAFTSRKKSPLLGVHDGVAYYLLYNGILGDKTVNGGNVLTLPILKSLPAHDGMKVIYGETSRLSPERLKAMNIVFKQTPYDVKAR